MVIWFVNRVRNLHFLSAPYRDNNSFAQITLNELGTAFSFVIPSICANRLLISCRRDNQPPQQWTSSSSIWRYKRQRQDTLAIELTTCNDVGAQTIP